MQVVCSRSRLTVNLLTHGNISKRVTDTSALYLAPAPMLIRCRRRPGDGSELSWKAPWMTYQDTGSQLTSLALLVRPVQKSPHNKLLFLQHHRHHPHPEKSTIIFLPPLNLSRSTPPCLSLPYLLSCSCSDFCHCLYYRCDCASVVLSHIFARMA